jgi:hypothetical protein
MDNTDLSYWNHYKLNVNTNLGKISIEWNDVETLAKYATLQSGLFAGSSDKLTKQLFFENFEKWAQKQWSWTEQLGGFDLPDNPTVLDIGSGISLLDLLLYSYVKNPTFYLVDKDKMEFKRGIYYSKNYPYYNSWGPVEDAITTSKFDNNKFIIQDPSVEWPKTDCISSYYSWCFHYPFETYWSRVQNSLKIGGKLILDVRLIEDENIIEIISKSFNCEPKVFEYPNALPEWIDNFKSSKSSVLGYRCVWIRNA